jgi:hypothetical protein
MEVYKVLQDLDVYSNIKAAEFAAKYEAPLMQQTLLELTSQSPEFFSEFCVCILLNNGVDVKNWNLAHFNDKRKVFILFDEMGRVPHELVQPSSNVVFHAYLSFAENEKQYINLFHYPLGCNSFVPETPSIPASERKYNVFFSGNLHIGRKKLFQKLTHLPFVPLAILTRIQKFYKSQFDDKFSSSYIRFTNGFSQGLSFSEYAACLSQSKIILSPPGISNLECFRHYEGLRAGCIVLAERLPIKRQYCGSPIFEIGNWSNGFKVIEELLADPERLNSVSKNSRDWYLNHFSPKAVAKYILESVNSTPNKS